MNAVEQRLSSQRLIGPAFESPEDVVAQLCAVQSQDYGGAKWALAQRLKKVDGARVEEAYQRGAILRTHVLRPTWHFVLPSDARWMLELTAPRIQRGLAGSDKKLELDARVRAKSRAVVTRALEGAQYKTRTELAGVLAKAGIRAHGQRLNHLMAHLELDCAIISGPRRGKQFTYALFDERVPASKKRPREEALCELAARYLIGHAPAEPKDFAWWAGLTLADAKMALAECAQPPAPRKIKPKYPLIYLLPNYDEYFIAYREQTKFAIQNRVVLDGEPIGTWKRVLEKDRVLVETKLSVKLTAPQRRALEDAASRYAQSLELELELELVSDPESPKLGGTDLAGV